MLLCVGTGNNLDTPNRMQLRDDRTSTSRRAAEMAALFPDQREAIAQHAPDRRDGRPAAAAGRAADPALPGARRRDGRDVAAQGVRGGPASGATARSRPTLQKRLDYELGVIISMGYAGYFLIVADFVRFAREQGIATTCRGSRAGLDRDLHARASRRSTRSHYGLPFERFLNPDRVTMPDIDVDFEDERRDEVINYVSRKYGTDHVAQIITFGTMLARAAIRDVGRVHGHGLRRGRPDRQGRPQPARASSSTEALDDVARSSRRCTTPTRRSSELIDFAQQLEGVARNASTHAAGVVISREPLTELMPLQRATNSDALMTQYEMHGIEALGLLKFDFLGLSNLTILRKAVDLIREHRGRRRSTSTTSRSTTRRRSSCWPRARRRACSSSSPRACAATSASCARRRSSTSRRWSRSTARARWTTSRPTSGASTARRR